MNDKNDDFIKRLFEQYTNPHFILLTPHRKSPQQEWKGRYPSLEDVETHLENGGNVGFTADNFLCLDIDDSKQCKPWLEQLDKDNLKTLTVKTPKPNGYHIYYKLAETQVVNSTPCKIEKYPLDTRGINHTFVVIPPSVVWNEDTSTCGTYSVMNESDPERGMIKTLPEEIYAKLLPYIFKGNSTCQNNLPVPCVMNSADDSIQQKFIEKMAGDFERVTPGNRNQKLLTLTSSGANVLPEGNKLAFYNAMIAGAYKNGYMNDTSKPIFDKQFESAWTEGKKESNGCGRWELVEKKDGNVAKVPVSDRIVIRDYFVKEKTTIHMEWDAINAQFIRLGIARCDGFVFFKSDVTKRFKAEQHKAFRIACEKMFRVKFDLKFTNMEDVLLNFGMDDTIETYDAIDTLPIFKHEDSIKIFSTFQPTSYERSYFNDLVDLFDNVETHHDKLLLKAAICTPMICGAGKNPLFVVMADMQGSGKTELVKAIGDLYGKNGCMKFLADKLDGTSIISDLLTNESKTRVILVDNLKKVADSSALEDFITSRTIQGHKMYIGHTVNYNMYTWFITANMPRLSRDMAQRAYIIKLQKPKTYSVAWQDALADLLSNHREEILSEISDILRGASQFTYSNGSERWPLWINSVLSKVCTEEEYEEIIALQQERRGEYDTQKNTAMLINEALQEWRENSKSNSMTYTDMCYLLNSAGITDGMKTRTLVNFLQPMVLSGELPIKLVKFNFGRRIVLEPKQIEYPLENTDIDSPSMFENTVDEDNMGF